MIHLSGIYQYLYRHHMWIFLFHSFSFSATRTQRLYLTNIKPLEELRADVVFKLTELELQLMPFRRKLNISLSHIHTAQYYIDNQGDIIAQKVNHHFYQYVLYYVFANFGKRLVWITIQNSAEMYRVSTYRYSVHFSRIFY